MIPEEIYSSQFFERIDAGCRSSAEIVVPQVLARVHPRSVVDVGCGTGVWLAEFINAGLNDVLGIDGAWVPREMLHIPAAQFLAHDLQEPVHVARTFDLVVCLEVAEHLPASAADTLVNSLTRLGNVVLFSAAIPGQGGNGHINEQPPEWWERLFAEHGFRRSLHFGEQFAFEPRVEWWYSRNMLLFGRNGIIPPANEVGTAELRSQTDFS